MTANASKILKGALDLPPTERADIANQLLSSLDWLDEQVDRLWRKEVEDRISAYQDGKIRSVSIEEVLSKYRK